MNKFNKIGDWIEAVFLAPSQLAFLGVGLLACLEVVLRYVFSKPHDWGWEVITFGVIYGAFLAGGPAVREGHHVAIDTLPLALKGRAKVALELFNHVITFAVCVALGWSAVLHMAFLAQIDSASISSLRIPDWFTRLALPIGLFGSAFFCLERIVRMVIKMRSGEGESGGSSIR